MFCVFLNVQRDVQPNDDRPTGQPEQWVQWCPSWPNVHCSTLATPPFWTFGGWVDMLGFFGDPRLARLKKAPGPPFWGGWKGEVQKLIEMIEMISDIFFRNFVFFAFVCSTFCKQRNVPIVSGTIPSSIHLHQYTYIKLYIYKKYTPSMQFCIHIWVLHEETKPWMPGRLRGLFLLNHQP